ncbi:hypothetical protein [Bacillus mycoides]|nr:hypothetical protein [Bacillus mycoides]
MKKDEPKYLIKDEISIFLIALMGFDIDFKKSLIIYNGSLKIVVL